MPKASQPQKAMLSKREIEERLPPVSAAIFMARRNQRMTQSDLAQAAGVSRRAISDIEAGKSCSLDTAEKILMALQLSLQVVPVTMPTIEDITQERKRAFEDAKIAVPIRVKHAQR